MKKILEFLGSNVFKGVSDLLDDLITNDEERLEAKRKIFETLKQKENELQPMQAAVI